MINLYRSKDGEIENLSDEEEEEEMFACEICDGLVKESDNECPHCGAIFEDEEDDEPEPPSRGPPRRAPPSAPSRGGPPSVPSRGGPPKGPSRGGLQTAHPEADPLEVQASHPHLLLNQVAHQVALQKAHRVVPLQVALQKAQDVVLLDE